MRSLVHEGFCQYGVCMSYTQDISADISLTEAVEVAGDLIAGKIRGRVVVNISE